MWTACTLSIFQLLSEDYISYVFFIFFVGMAIGAVQVITVPYVIEMVREKNCLLKHCPIRFFLVFYERSSNFRFIINSRCVFI